MNFSDIFKQSFLDSFAADFSLPYILAVMGFTCLLALYIFFVYRIVTRKTFYNKSMNVSLAAISIITASVILTVQSSLVISLGMVGALSIVRFRTAIKDPMDLVFLFWSISIGIICGAGLAKIAVVTSIILTITILVLNHIPVAKAPLMLIVNSSDIAGESDILEVVQKYSRFYKVKSRNYSRDSLDMVIELRTKEEQKCVREVAELPSILSASLLAHDGEVTF